jgi:predicted amidophosphoribosyltransferase
MTPTCPLCGQRLPSELRRICAKCHQPILKHHKYQYVGPLVIHRDCDDPTLSKQQEKPEGLF